MSYPPHLLVSLVERRLIEDVLGEPDLVDDGVGLLDGGVARRVVHPLEQR